MRYRYDIEGLRAIAVLAVLLYHFGVPGLDGGFVGVDVFFVISGFLITSLLIHERDTRGSVSFVTFYARRARRLLPISATVLVATACAGAILLPATRLPDLADEVTASALFGANVLFAHRGTDYLTAALDLSPLQHYWSLSVEEQFYLLWPAIIALVTIGARVVRLRVAAAMAAIVVVSFTASVLLTPSQPSWSYFGLHTRAWELGVGALLASMTRGVDRIPARGRAALGWIGLVGIAVSVVTFGDVAFPGWIAALPVLSTAAVLMAGQRTRGGPGNLLMSEPLTYLGSRSYSLYLWHWPVLIIAEARLDRSLDWPEKAAAALLVMLLAEVGYRTVEHPIRSSPRLALRKTFSLGLGAALVVTSVLTGAVLGAYRPDLSTGIVAAAPVLTATSTATTTPADAASTTTAPTPADESSSTVPAPTTFLDNLAATPPQPIVDAIAATVVPDNVRPSLMSAKNDVGLIYGDDCHVYYDSEVSTDCVYGDPDGTITVALWGDSHAAQWFPALDAIASAHGWRLLSLTQGGCPYLEVTVWNRSDNAVFRHCEPWRTSVRAYLVEQGVDVVFLSQHYGLRAADTREAIPVSTWQAQLPPLLASLIADGIHPVVIADSPNPPDDVPQCVAEHRRQIQVCNATLDDPAANDITAAIVATATATSGAAGVIDPNRWLCVNGTCPVVVGDILAYRDGDHLSNTFVAWLFPVLEALIVGPVDRIATGDG